MPAGSTPPPDPSEAVVREHADAARRLARHLVFDRDRADDVAQDAMRVALVRPAADGLPPKAWLHGIVRNVARALIRRDGRRRTVETRAVEDLELRRRDASTDDPAALVARAEEHRRVIEAVLRLEEPYRSTLILRFLEDLEPSEVARRLAAPVETVRTRVRRGLDLVRTDLDQCHGGDRRRWFSLLVPIPALAPPSIPRPSPVPTPAIAVAGALAMKKVAAVIVVILLAAGAWRFWPETADDGAHQRSDLDAGVVSTTEAPPREPTLAANGRARPDSNALPQPVALDAPGVIDRDRDIHGVVVNEGGAPVAGAVVRAVARPWSGAVLIGSQSFGGEIEVAATRTASDGTFALRLERGAAATLRVTASGFAPFEEGAVGAGERLRVVLRPGVRFVVLVKNAAGGAVPNAVVRLYRLSGEATWGYVRASYHREGTTDAAGRFAFEDLPAGSGGTWTLLNVEAPGVGQTSHERVDMPERGEATHEVVLRAARTLRGRVTDAGTTKPIAGAVVGIGWEQEPRVTTDSAGKYAMPVGSDPKSTTVFAEAVGYAWLGVEGEREEGTIDFALVRAATLRGRLVDVKGSPVADATLTAHGTMGASLPTGRAEGRSGSDGRFELVGLSPNSTSELWIEAAGFGQRGLALDAIGETRMRDLGDIVLSAGRRIEGRAVDPVGKPVAGVYVALRGGSAEQGQFWTGTERTPGRLNDTRVTDDLGRFRFADVAPGGYRLTAQAGGQAKQEQRVTVGGDDVLGIEFTLRSGRTLVVHVRGPDGKPLSWTSVEVRLPDGSSHREQSMGTSEVAFVVPDDEVRVQVVGLQPGQSAPEAQLVPKGTDEVTITLVPADDWAVEGTVLDPDGAPLAAAGVIVARKDFPTQMGSMPRTDRLGRFRAMLRGGDRATVTVTGETFDSTSGRAATQGAFEADPVEVTRGSTDVVIRTRRLPSNQMLRVVVQDPDGRTLLGIPINLQRPNGATFLEPGVVSADGTVEFKGLVGRPVQVGRGSGAYTMGETWIDPFLEVVPAGQTVVYRFLAGTVVRGVVRKPDGAPAPYAIVTANSGQRGRTRYCSAGEDGHFAIALDPRLHFPLVLSVYQGGGDKAVLKGKVAFDAMPSELVTIRLAAPPLDTK